jgi:thiol:disulfide interchange protein DsbA
VKNRRLTNCLALAGMLLLAACGKEEQPAETDVVPPAIEDPAADAAGDPATEAAGEAEQAVEVVEESAADPGDESTDKILLAHADTATPAADYKYKEGTHYARLVPTQPTIGGADKIEVAEFFWYGCPHCYDLEPTINKWAENVPPTVRFVRVPAMWNQVLKLHAQLYYTEEVLARNGALKDPEKFHAAVFEEYHQRNNRLLNEDVIKRLFSRFGVGEEDFTKTWSSFEVAQKLRVAEDLARRYSISSVPTIVVNGKYRTGGAEAGSYEKLIEVVDELVDREGTR